MTVLITVNIPQGSFAGPFNLLSNADSYDVPFASNITAENLSDGFLATNVLDDSTIIRVQSLNGCTNYYDALIVLPPFCDSNIIIGSQLWMACNLNVDKYSDETPIPEVQDAEEWAALTTGAWCYYNNDLVNGNTYGKMYNWYAVAGVYDAASLSNPTLRKKLAPEGWHIPSQTEIDALIDYSGGNSVAGSRLKEANDLHWTSPNTGAINLNNFTALGGGERNFNGSFLSKPIKEVGSFWSNAEITNNEFSKALYLQSISNEATLNTEYTKKGLSVRCINDAIQPLNCNDVLIGTQTWTRCNLDVVKFRNGDTILQATTIEEWSTAAQNGTPAWCWNNFSAYNGATYGKLYNGHAVTDITHGGIAPLGYHIPSDEEFTILANYLGGSFSCAFKLREPGTVHWNTLGNPIATNSSNFTALGAGSLNNGYTPFTLVKAGAYFWTTTPNINSQDELMCRFIFDSSNSLFDANNSKSNGYSIRLIKDLIV